MDSLLDWVVVILPFAAGLYLAVKPPKRVRWGLIALGLAVSVLTFVQQDRSRKTHEGELLQTTTQLEQTSKNLEKLSTLFDQYMNSRNTEEAKILGEAVKKALQQAQQTARPASPYGLTATAQ